MNLGYTGGNNIGIKHALEKEDCDYILILNDYAIVDSNLLNELINVAEEYPKIAIANPKILCFENPNKLCKPYGKHNFYSNGGKTRCGLDRSIRRAYKQKYSWKIMENLLVSFLSEISKRLEGNKNDRKD